MSKEEKAVKLTKADVANWRMREAAHYNGGKVFFAYLHRCIEQPRLARYDRYERATRSVASTWRVDGVDKSSLEDAIEALNLPPAFDAQEIEYLLTVPEEWTKKPGPGLIDWVVNGRCVDKGAVEWNDRQRRLTDLGRSVLAALEAKEGGE